MVRASGLYTPELDVTTEFYVGEHRQGNTFTSDRVSIGHSLPTVPSGGNSSIWRSSCLPSPSTIRRSTPRRGSPCLMVICPKRKQSITERTKAYTVYIAPKIHGASQRSYQLTIIKAAQQYDGLQWRAYDTDFRVATGNRELSKVDVDLYTRRWHVATCVIAHSIWQQTARSRKENCYHNRAGWGGAPGPQMCALCLTPAASSASGLDAGSTTYVGSVAGHTR